MNNNAKFAFWYLLSLVALVFMAISTGLISFQIINQQLVDATTNYAGLSQEALKFAISALLIAAPVFYWLTVKIRQALKNGDLSAEAGIRRWLTYFILFVSAVVVIIWLIMTVNSFLNGELTGKFILKALTVLLIAGVIFGYYFYDIKQGEKADVTLMRIFAWGSLALVVAAFTAAFFFVESPKAARDRKHDQNIINDLSAIENAVNVYYDSQKMLPESLNDLQNAVLPYYLPDNALIDEAGGQAYEYGVLSVDRYQLCAEFYSSSKEQKAQNNRFYVDERWQYKPGRQCFERQVIKARDGSLVAPLPKN